ncbi:Fic domain protein, PA0574 type [hydrothermal vent metagenome]|uniref:Fic domain protein, PA0574 type n=1 Tax=hydrothermal vent metagenome TaxID=652676 RepID=A0A3B0W330_9ZZZZ
MWIWEQKKWPNFEYDVMSIMPYLEQTVRVVSPLVTLARQLEQDKCLRLETQVLLDEVLSTAKIEGEILDRESVRSSIANRLGIGEVSCWSKSSQAFVDVLLESIRTSDQALTEPTLFKWHQMLFIEKPQLYDMRIGCYRNDSMQVVSGRYGKQRVHFETPCKSNECVKSEMASLFCYINEASNDSYYIKAAMAKFWFVTIHPFDDGNGRFSRIIAERLLAKSENTTARFYSLSTQIEKNRKEYYDILERTQKGSLELTEWIIWFLKQVQFAAESSLQKLEKIQLSTVFWDKYQQVSFNTRQRKILQKLLEEDGFLEGMTRKKYKKIVRASDATLARDLKDLVDKGVLIIKGSARATKYILAL